MKKLTLFVALASASFLQLQPASAASLILSQVEVEVSPGISNRSTSMAAGAVATTVLGSGQGRVQTDLGLNKVFLSATSNIENSYATSIWAETLTVSGVGLVTITHNFQIDGTATPFNPIGSEDVNFNYYLKAVSGNISSFVADSQDALRFEDTFFHAGGRDIFVDGFDDISPVLASASLCPLTDGEEDGGTCGSGTFNSNIQLSFTLAAGSTYTLVGGLTIEDLKFGTLDFFNTARLTGISVSPGGTLSSESGRLELNNGVYAFAPVGGNGVPETSSWAMMLAGFLISGLLLRNKPKDYSESGVTR